MPFVVDAWLVAKAEGPEGEEPVTCPASFSSETENTVGGLSSWVVKWFSLRGWPKKVFLPFSW